MTSAANDDRRLGRPRDARVDAAVLDATRELLAEKGFGATTVDEIVARAGVGKAAVYRRWRTREDLLLAVMRSDLPAIEEPDTGDLRNDMAQLFTQLAEQIQSSGPASYLGDMISESARNPAMRDGFQALVQSRRAVCKRLIDRAKKRGEVPRRIDPDLVLDLIGGAIVYGKLFRDDVADRRYVEAAVDTVLDGILAH